MRDVRYLISAILYFLVVSLLFATPSLAETSTPTSAPVKSVDYTLPYPGLLPDNPLYPVKAGRDRMISWFISDPLQKARFDLLQSDKRVNASLYLFNQDAGKQDLIITTLSKAENYFDEGVGQLHQAKTQGEDIRDAVRMFTKSSQKYDEVIRTMEAKEKGDFKNKLTGNDQRITQFEKTVDKMGEK